MDFLTETKNRGFAGVTIYLDFAKAFDKVSHKALLYKLEKMGFDGVLLNWLKDFLQGRKQRVALGDSFSSWLEVLSGVAQGSVLGPLLFVIFINDMPEVTQNLCELFADDSKILAQIKNPNDQLLVQKDLDSLVKWSQDWNMLFNNKKCKVMNFGAGKNSAFNSFEYSMDDGSGDRHILEKTKVERDLGIYISDDLKWKENALRAASKANWMLGQLKRSINYWDATKLRSLYTSYVRPHLEYASPVCCPYLVKDIKILETVQRRATKFVPELRNLPYSERLKRLNLTTLEVRRQRGDAIQFYKLTNGFNQVNWYHPNTITNSVNLCGPASSIRGEKHRLTRQFTRNCNPRENFFPNRVVPIWNSLPTATTKVNSVENFKIEYDFLTPKNLIHERTSAAIV
jgi:hypothetical protein